MSEHAHEFSAGPNCSVCGLHASTVKGGALSPEAITKLLASGARLWVEAHDDQKRMDPFLPLDLITPLVEAANQMVDAVGWGAAAENWGMVGEASGELVKALAALPELKALEGQ